MNRTIRTSLLVLGTAALTLSSLYVRSQSRSYESARVTLLSAVLIDGTQPPLPPRLLAIDGTQPPLPPRLLAIDGALPPLPPTVLSAIDGTQPPLSPTRS